MGAGALSAALNSLPPRIDRDTCVQVLGEAYNEAEYDYFAESDGMIARDVLLERLDETDVFVSHDWGIDQLGRINHERVVKLVHELNRRMIRCWFDEQRLQGNIVQQMCAGIDKTQLMVVCITQRYVDKVRGQDAHDNCQKEFLYGCTQLSGARMIAVVMEPDMKDTKRWLGPVGMALSNNLYVDYTSDYNFEASINNLCSLIRSKIQTRYDAIGMRNTLKMSSNIKIMNSASKNIPLLYHTSDEASIIPLMDLSVHQVCQLFSGINITGCDDIIIKHKVDGAALSVINSIDEIDEIGFPIKLSTKKKALLVRITDFKYRGVPLTLLAESESTITKVPPMPPIVADEDIDKGPMTTEQLARRLSEVQKLDTKEITNQEQLFFTTNFPQKERIEAVEVDSEYTDMSVTEVFITPEDQSNLIQEIKNITNLQVVIEYLMDISKMRIQTIAESLLIILDTKFINSDVIEKINNRSAFGEVSGTMEALVKTIFIHHQKSLYISEIGLALIAELGYNDINILKLGLAGACELIITIFHRYDNNELISARIAESGLIAIGNLAVDDENIKKLNTAGVCSLVVRLLRAYGNTSVNIAESGLSAILNLAAASEEIATNLGESGACEVIVSLLDQYLGSQNCGVINQNIAQNGAWAIVNIILDHEVNKARLLALNIKEKLKKYILENENVIDTTAKEMAMEAINSL